MGFPGEDLTRPHSRRAWQRPVVGTTMDVRIGDPRDQAGLIPGATSAWLFFSGNRTTPCGTPLPGLGAGGGPGELLLDANRTPESFGTPVVWNGPNSATRVSLRIPNDSSLVGRQAMIQGVLSDGRTSRLTDAVRLRFGDQ
jgi:hypothetical protein